LPELTVLLLAGPAIGYVAEAARMARALQPALVVLEDCDLVGQQPRDAHRPQPLLFTVLETLDGLGDDADVAFLLTTNRIDGWSRARQRPGRVDLAVEIPLPDAVARRRLIQVYARDLPFTPAALERAAERTDGVTASFAKELLRRAVLIAADAGHAPPTTTSTRPRRDAVPNESITRSLLGTTT